MATDGSNPDAATSGQLLPSIAPTPPNPTKTLTTFSNIGAASTVHNEMKRVRTYSDCMVTDTRARLRELFEGRSPYPEDVSPALHPVYTEDESVEKRHCGYWDSSVHKNLIKDDPDGRLALAALGVEVRDVTPSPEKSTGLRRRLESSGKRPNLRMEFLERSNGPEGSYFPRERTPPTVVTEAGPASLARVRHHIQADYTDSAIALADGENCDQGEGQNPGVEEKGRRFHRMAKWFRRQQRRSQQEEEAENVLGNSNVQKTHKDRNCMKDSKRRGKTGDGRETRGEAVAEPAIDEGESKGTWARRGHRLLGFWKKDRV